MFQQSRQDCQYVSLASVQVTADKRKQIFPIPEISTSKESSFSDFIQDHFAVASFYCWGNPFPSQLQVNEKSLQKDCILDPIEAKRKI